MSKFSKEEPDVYKAALRLLRFRLRSENELLERLTKKFPQKEVSAVLKRLKKEGFLDDKAFARAWVQDRMRFKPKGRRLVFRELVQKGVSENLIKKILKKEYNEEKEVVLAERAAKTKIQKLKGLPKIKARQRLVHFLQRRGFGWEAIKRVLNEIH